MHEQSRLYAETSKGTYQQRQTAAHKLQAIKLPIAKTLEEIRRARAGAPPAPDWHDPTQKVKSSSGRARYPNPSRRLI
jgi:hypothetical protein